MIGIFDQPLCVCVCCAPSSSSSSPPSLILGTNPTTLLSSRTADKRCFIVFVPLDRVFLCLHCRLCSFGAGQIGISSHIFSGIFTTLLLLLHHRRDLITRRPTPHINPRGSLRKLALPCTESPNNQNQWQPSERSS